MSDPVGLARYVGAARIAAGLAFVAAPRRVGGLLVGGDAEAPGARLFIVAFGARDVLLGAGTLRAATRRQPIRPWLASCAAADAFDAVATLRSFHDLPPGRRVLTFVISLIPGMAGGWLASQLDA
jgi:hypothetical protein